MNDPLRDMRRRAVALVEQLVGNDERMVAMQAELSGLRQAAARRATARGGTAMPTESEPRAAWPLADDPGLDPATLGYYERRVDDPAILEAREGDGFLRRFRLADDDPDLDGAVAALRELPRRLPHGPDPDVSIVIPVYGQAGYTLNCLHSLLAHRARAACEIVVVDDASPDASAEVIERLGVAGLRSLRLAVNGGFIAACNAGVAAARGRFVVLLNNDTRVVAGWLDALVDSFAHHPRAGLVGSKLLYPSGTLQEAGGIVWRDGSAWNYGREDDPNRPRYTHARQADYVSGASVALRLALWRELGGLDAHFAPAYCEDSDLGLRVRAAGYEVWFQPQSRVIHYEGRTAGTDTEQGVKRHQTRNTRKVLLRWRETLQAHRRNGEAPYFERERRQHKRALVVDATNPTPSQDAGSVTTTQTLGLFQELGYKVHFVPQDNFLYEPGHTDALLRMGIECAYAPYDSGFEDYVERYGDLFDVVLVYRVTVLDRVLADLRRHAPQAAVLFHAMDLHFLRMERAATVEATDEAVAAAAEMKRRELALVGEVDATITHSTFEQALLAREAPGAPVVVWPFMFEFHGTTAGFEARADFCFLGGYRHQPNIDAAVHLARDVLPLIRRELPHARLVLAGANPGPEVLALAGADVEVTGMVDDLRDVFDRVRVFACGLRIGAGTKGKISTAMAYGLPVVSTSCGAEGMDLADGDEALIADGPEAFAAACVRLHRDAALWRQLSQAGQALVQRKHSLAMGRRTLEQGIETALAHRLGLDQAEEASPIST